MFAEQGAFELIFLAAVALIVVGPKDLPVLMRKVGQFTAKMRGLAAEFRASFDEMARQSELDELRKEVEALRQGVQAPNIHQMMGTGPVKRDLEQHWDELHHGIAPGGAPAGWVEPDSPDSADSVSGVRTTATEGAELHSPHSVHSDFDAGGAGAPGGDVHSVHSVHPDFAVPPRAERDSADSPDSVSEPYVAPRPEHPPVSTLAPQPVPEPHG